jgi:cysteinyl-tRNA synthetase
MAMRYLGESIDLHGGGLDLVFPHHENEIAQAEAATGRPFTRLWMHHGFVETNREKMSKSLGNFLTARDCFRLAEPEALRYLMYTVHYRAPLALDWSSDEQGSIVGCGQLDDAERRVEYVYRTRARLEQIPASRMVDTAVIPDGIAGFADKLASVLDDDLNTPIALATAAEFLKHVNELAESAKTKQGKVPRAALDAARAGFDALARVLALGNDDPAALLDRIRTRRAARLGLQAADVEAKIAARKQARTDRDFARADAIRDEIAAAGIELMDAPEGTTWRIP